jgi:Fe-S-cluster containining protein
MDDIGMRRKDSKQEGQPRMSKWGINPDGVGIRPLPGPGVEYVWVGVMGMSRIYSNGKNLEVVDQTPRRVVSCADTDEKRTELDVWNNDGFWFSQAIVDHFKIASARCDKFDLLCGSCGACCHQMVGGKKMIINLSAAQSDLIESAYPGCTVPYTEDERKMRTAPCTEKSSACMFWKGKPGKTSTCGIYRQRPQVCRIFQTGMNDCLIMRDSYFTAYPERDNRSDEERHECLSILNPQNGCEKPEEDHDGKEGTEHTD